MRKISDTIARLAALRAPQGFQSVDQGKDRLSDLVNFGTNPGALRAKIYIPDELPYAAPLVVVLHCCTQSAAGYDHGSGWSQLADQEGFALLFPEQQRANNASLCFNWFCLAIHGATPARPIPSSRRLKRWLSRMASIAGGSSSPAFPPAAP